MRNVSWSILTVLRYKFSSKWKGFQLEKYIKQVLTVLLYRLSIDEWNEHWIEKRRLVRKRIRNISFMKHLPNHRTYTANIQLNAPSPNQHYNLPIWIQAKLDSNRKHADSENGRISTWIDDLASIWHSAYLEVLIFFNIGRRNHVQIAASLHSHWLLN